MCIADIAISRRCYVKSTAIAPATTTEIPPNPDRLAFIMSVASGGGLQTRIAANMQDALTGQFIYTAEHNILLTGNYGFNHNIVFTYLTHPGIVQLGLAVYSNAASYVYETIMNDDLANELRQYLKEQIATFKRRGP